MELAAVSTEMQENTWARLRESSMHQVRVTQPSPRIILHMYLYIEHFLINGRNPQVEG